MLLPGTLEVLILRALHAGPRHGYAIAEFIHQASDDVLAVEEGALYPALHRLEVRGALSSYWGASENNRKAKFYRLTKAGEKELAEQTAFWQQLVLAMRKVLEA